ncbi:MAG TPA: phosphoribosylamine--glycine ligase [bacterium]|nr:phosphoribosylamine--glycine ligase [bacterium]
MKVLVVGSGGREHALVWKIRQSPLVKKVFAAPGNGGIRTLAECVDISVTDSKGLIQFARKHQIDLTVVGPELPLTQGIVDLFTREGYPIFGPARKAAQLEGSKAFAKDLMLRCRIPTADFRVYNDVHKAVEAIQEIHYPTVIKADGLAAGKGVLICRNRKEAYDGLEQILRQKVFGDAGNQVVIEEYLQGEEVSVLAVTDGERFVILPPAQDHKPVFEGDTGPNTGGMGAYAPAPVMTEKMIKIVNEKIIKRAITGLTEQGIRYRGVLYAGLMMTSAGPKVLEFNCRFGDPETQAILPLLNSDIVELMFESLEGRIGSTIPDMKKGGAVCVVMASGGYPGSYEKGKVIHGLDRIPGEVMVFHAGTQYRGNQIVTSGGRVLGVTAWGDDISKAVKTAYDGVNQITFDGAYYRRDIGYRALRRDNSRGPGERPLS